MEFFDGKNLLDLFMLSAIKESDETAYMVLQIFKKHNIGTTEALAILMEMAQVIEGKEQKNE